MSGLPVLDEFGLVDEPTVSLRGLNPSVDGLGIGWARNSTAGEGGVRAQLVHHRLPVRAFRVRALRATLGEMGKTQAERPPSDAARSPARTPPASVSVPSSQQAFLTLGSAIGNRAVRRLVDDDQDAPPTTKPATPVEPGAVTGEFALGLHLKPGAELDIGDENGATPSGDETTRQLVEWLLEVTSGGNPEEDWKRPIEEVKERNKGWLAAKFDRSESIELPFSESWATNATDASVTNALLQHLFAGKERGPNTFARLRNSLDLRSYGGSVAQLGDDVALRENLRQILLADPTAKTFKYEIKPGTLGVIEEAYRRLRVFEVKRGREIYEAAAEETGQMVFDFYRAQGNGIVRLINGAVAISAEPARRLGIIDKAPEIPEMGMVSKWGQDNKRTMEISADIALLFVGGVSAAGTKMMAAQGSLKLSSLTVRGLNVGPWLNAALKTWLTVGGVSSVEQVATQSRDSIETLIYQEVYDPETGITRPITEDEYLDAWKQLFDVASGSAKDRIVGRRAKQKARQEADAAPHLEDPGTTNRDRVDDATETTADLEGESTTRPRERTETGDAALADVAPPRLPPTDSAVKTAPASRPSPDGPANVSGRAKGKGKAKGPGKSHRRLAEEGEARSWQRYGDLITTKDITKVRKMIDDGDYGKTEKQKAEVLKEFELARLNEIEMTESAVAQTLLEKPATRVQDGQKSYLDETFEVRFDDVGSPGFLSDRDRMVTVKYSDPELNRLAKEFPDAAATLAKKSIAIVEATNKKLADGSAETALDTNHYTDLHEERFVPTTPDELSAVNLDQDIAALTVQKMRMPEAEWHRHVSKLVEGLDKTTSKRLQDKIDQASSRAATLQQKKLPQAYAELTQALSKKPLDIVEIRRLATDVKLLEPDAYGVRDAVLETRASQELSKVTHNTRGDSDGADGKGDSDGAEGDYSSPVREQVSAAAKNVTRGSDAGSVKTQAHRAAQHYADLTYKTNPSGAGNMLPQVAAAAKHLLRIFDAVENAGKADPQIAGMVDTITNIIEAKKIGDAGGAEKAHKAIDRWATGSTGPEVSRVEPTMSQQAAFDTFVKEAIRLGGDASRRLTVIDETASKEE